MDRFGFDEEEGLIIDKREGKFLNDTEILNLLNRLNNNLNNHINELNRIYEGMNVLDVQLGLLSWYSEKESEYTLEDIQKISLTLSKTFVDILYPKNEEKVVREL